MIALLYDVSVFHDQNQIRILDGGKPVGNDEAGPSLHQIIHGLLNLDLCSGIHRGGGLIQDHDGAVAQNGSGYGQELLLALGNVAGFFVQFHLIAPWLRGNKVMDMSRLSRLNHLFIGGIQPAVPDIFHDGAGKQPGILQHHAEQFPHLAPVKFRNVMAINPDAAAIQFIEPHQQLHHGGLAGSCGANNGDLLTVFDLCGKIMNDDLIRLIAKLHMIKFHIAPQRVHIHIGDSLHFLFRLFQELKYTFGSRRRGLQHIGHLGDLLDGLGKVADILEERLDLAHFNDLTDGKKAAQESHHYISNISHKLHDRHHHTGKALGFPGRFIKLPVGLLEFCHHILFFVKYFHHIVAAVDLFHLPIDFSQICLLRLEIFLGTFHHFGNDEHGHRKNQQRHQGHPYVDAQHHDEHTHQGGDGCDQLGHALVQTHLQRIHIIGHTGKDLSVCSALEIT